MIEHQEQIIRETTNNHCTNIATLVFLGDFIGHHQRGVDPIIEAIEGKYDALRNKLLMQTLKKQVRSVLDMILFYSMLLPTNHSSQWWLINNCGHDQKCLKKIKCFT